MRIIAGKYKRRRLYEVLSDDTRSTKDRVKETLFTMLGPFPDYPITLDLFAGSGALGLEALSRFSEACDFVELDGTAYKVLERNIQELKLENITSTYRMDAYKFIHHHKKTYDLIILDPPYKEGILNDFLKRIQESHLLAIDGIIVTLSHKNDTVQCPNHFKIAKERNVGITKILFIEWSDNYESRRLSREL